MSLTVLPEININCSPELCILQFIAGQHFQESMIKLTHNTKNLEHNMGRMNNNVPSCSTAKIFVYKHCFCYLNVQKVLTKEFFVSPANSSLVGILITIDDVTDNADVINSYFAMQTM